MVRSGSVFCRQTKLGRSLVAEQACRRSGGAHTFEQVEDSRTQRQGALAGPPHRRGFGYFGAVALAATMVLAVATASSVMAEPSSCSSAASTTRLLPGSIRYGVILLVFGDPFRRKLGGVVSFTTPLCAFGLASASFAGSCCMTSTSARRCTPVAGGRSGPVHLVAAPSVPTQLAPFATAAEAVTATLVCWFRSSGRTQHHDPVNGVGQYTDVRVLDQTPRTAPEVFWIYSVPPGRLGAPATPLVSGFYASKNHPAHPAPPHDSAVHDRRRRLVRFATNWQSSVLGATVR